MTRRRVTNLLIDWTLVGIALMLAIALRDNLELRLIRLERTQTYFLCTMAMALVVLPAFGLDRMIWRLSSFPDYLRAFWAVLALVLASLTLTFAIDRLQGLSRAIPVLQAILTTCFLVGVRIGVRTRGDARKARRAASHVRQNGLAEIPHTRTVLIVGVSRLGELYAQAIKEYYGNSVRVAGLVGRTDRQVGRRVGAHKVLGRPEDIVEIVQQQEIHGVFIDRIVVTEPAETLSDVVLQALRNLEKSTAIEVQHLAADLKLAPETNEIQSPAARFAKPDAAIVMSPATLEQLASRSYWKIKRACDFCLALILIIVLFPVMALVGLLVLFDVGAPIVFWQVRPGRFGQHFKLYKLRTMRAAHTPRGDRIPDSKRVSAIGHFLRRTRLDELPQLFNILVGEMSFIGPRPLLPVDQPEGYAARLLARPGLTGWAQVVGGRAISPSDKAMLDVWYVQNASLGLDLRIILATIPMVLIGERTDFASIERAKNELQNAKILQPHLSHN